MVDIVGYEGYYQINRNGEIYSIKSDKLMKISKSQDGYLKVILSKDGYQRVCFIHRMVYKTFCGEIPDNLHIDHIDGIKDHNYPENLRLVTISQNNQHTYDLQLRKTRLEINQVKQIKQYLNEGLSLRAIARKFEISSATVVSIKYNRTWSRI